MLIFAMFMSACGAVIVMSSAYVASCTESGGSGMSEVYMLKGMGEMTPPCGTPYLKLAFCRIMVPECCVCHASFNLVCDVSEYGMWYVSVCEFIY